MIKNVSFSQGKLIKYERSKTGNIFIYDLRLRKYIKEEKEFESQKRQHESKLERLEYGNVKKKKNDILVQYDKLEKSQSEKKGRMAEMDVAIRGLEAELETDKWV